jgi:hypothetical protein
MQDLGEVVDTAYLAPSTGIQQGTPSATSATPRAPPESNHDHPRQHQSQGFEFLRLPLAVFNIFTTAVPGVQLRNILLLNVSDTRYAPVSIRINT